MPMHGKKVTVALTPDVERFINSTGKEVFSNCSRSDVVRSLIDEGLSASGKKRSIGYDIDERR